MKGHVLVDTGPIVAFLNREDEYHDWAVMQWDAASPPMLTCEAVVSEACFLLTQMSGAHATLMALLQRGIIETPWALQEHIEPVARLLAKYRDAPMSFADACLVRMSELHLDSPVLTIDSHFRLYRRNGRQVIPTVMP